MFFRKLLIAIDDSAPSQYAIDVGLIIAQRDHDCEVVFCLVLDPAILAHNFGFSSISEMAEKVAEDLLAGAIQRAKQRGIVASSKVLFSDATKGIIDLAKAENVGMIVMGTHGRSGIARALTRSIAEEVLRQTKTPLCVIRRPPIGKIHDRLLVPIADDELGKLASCYAVDLARSYNSTIRFCTVADNSSPRSASAFLAEMQQYAWQNGVESDAVVLDGKLPVCQAIQQHAETQDTDVIIMASHARDGFMRLVQGSVTEAVIRTSLIPVIVLR